MRKPSKNEEEISDDLLANVPELENAEAPAMGAFSGFPVHARDEPASFAVVEEDGGAGAVATVVPPVVPRPFPLGGDAPVVTPTPFPLGGAAAPPLAALDVDPALLAMDVHGLVGQARSTAESSFQQEMAKVESAVGGLLQQMEARLQQAELELKAAQAEHEKVKADTDRKAEALRELKKALESI